MGTLQLWWHLVGKVYIQDYRETHPMSSPTPTPSCSFTGLGKTFGNEFLHTVHNTALLVCRMRGGAYSLNIVAFSLCIIDTAFRYINFLLILWTQLKDLLTCSMGLSSSAVSTPLALHYIYILRACNSELLHGNKTKFALLLDPYSNS